MNKKQVTFALLLTLLLTPLATHADAQEYIQSFDVQLSVNQDATLDVTEVIKLETDNSTIQHGIYRDIPTTLYNHNGSGEPFRMPISVNQVLRGNTPEPYRTEYIQGGFRIQIGSEDVALPPGEYTYTIDYTVSRTLQFLDDRDRLYWNAVGNGWPWRIDASRVTVQLPAQANVIDARGFTDDSANNRLGEPNVSAEAYTIFQTTQTLPSHSNFTVLVDWQKGVVAAPSVTEQQWWLIEYQLPWILPIIGLVLLLTYFILIWWKVGRDPKAGTIIAQYEAPAGLSPAAMRFLQRRSADNKTLAATLIHTSILGHTHIDQTSKKDFTVTHLVETQHAVSLPTEETLMLDSLFDGATELKLKPAAAKKVTAALSAMRSDLKTQTKHLMTFNYGYLIPGIIFAVIYGALCLVLLSLYAPHGLWGLFLFGGGSIAIVALFTWLLHTYTKAGRKLLDEVEGFKLFLSVTEKDRLNFHNPPNKTPELFEKMLPYAVALGVEHKWSEQFSDVFKRLEQTNQTYAPSWYTGVLIGHSFASFGADLGQNLNSAIGTAHTPQSSGGGFAGGGAGGGGGGGW